MPNLVVLGTDTDAGKTTFCLLWLSAYAGFHYWKPLETGPSDSDRVREWTGARVHSPCRSFREPVAPLLAAQRENSTVPEVAELLEALPQPTDSRIRILVIETFGSPFSPLTADTLQIEFVKAILAGEAASPACVLVSSSNVGAIGRTIQCLDALSLHCVKPLVVLLGERDDFAAAQIRQHRDVIVYQLHPPSKWNQNGIRRAALAQRDTLEAILHSALVPKPTIDPESLITRDRAHVWHPYTPLADIDPPLACRAALDEYLELTDGRLIIDGISSWWTILHGHRFPPLMAALHEAMQRFDHVHFAGMTHAPAVELAELLLRTAPWDEGRVFFSDNGSTAVEVALKMAYQYWRQRGQPQRTCFIGFEHSYHGDTFGAMAVSRDPIFFGPFEPLLFKAEIVPLDANRLADTLRKIQGQIAAVILEPLVQGAGGMKMHSPETLREIVRATHDADVLFIADEVMTCCRTGTLWAHQRAGVAPDLICASKTLAGGVLPLAVTLASPSVVAAFNTADRTRTFFHGHSFTAHPIACSVAAANWRILLAQPDTNAHRLEQFWRHALAPLEQHPLVREVRIRGSIAALELDVQGGYLADIGRELRTTCLKNDVLLRPLGNVLYAMPPLRTSNTSLEQIAEAMRAAVAAASSRRG